MRLAVSFPIDEPIGLSLNTVVCENGGFVGFPDGKLALLDNELFRAGGLDDGHRTRWTVRKETRMASDSDEELNEHEKPIREEYRCWILQKDINALRGLYERAFYIS